MRRPGHVRHLPRLRPPGIRSTRCPRSSDDEDEMLECTTAERTDRSRLGCQIIVGADLDGDRRRRPRRPGLGGGHDRALSSLAAARPACRSPIRCGPRATPAAITLLGEEPGLPVPAPAAVQGLPGRRQGARSRCRLRGGSVLHRPTTSTPADGVHVTAIDRDSQAPSPSTDGAALAYSTAGAGHRRAPTANSPCPGATWPASTGCAPWPTPRPCTPASPRGALRGRHRRRLHRPGVRRRRPRPRLRRDRAGIRRPRPMGRALTPVMGELLRRRPPRLGVDLRLGEGIAASRADADGRVAAAVSTSGERYPADLVLVGVGVMPATELAAAAGLEVGRTASWWTERCAPPTRTSTPSATAPVLPERARRGPDPAGVRAERHRPGPARRPRHPRGRPSRATPTCRGSGPPRGRCGCRSPASQRPATNRGPRRPGGGEVLRLLLPRRRLAAVESVNRPPTTWPPARLLAAGARVARSGAEAAGFTLKAAAAAAQAAAGVPA